MLLDRLINFFTSLKLTVVCLTLALVLVFIGTLAQVDLGLYRVQAEYFRSFFIFWGPKGADWKMPVYPGGYLIGGFLIINLIAAYCQKFTLSRDKLGTLLTHGGLILLLLGQLSTDLLSRESNLHVREGQSKNFSESDRLMELAIVETSDPAMNSVVAVPDSRLATGATIARPELPFTIQVKRFMHNSALSAKPESAFEKSPATRGIGEGIWMREEPKVTRMDARDLPTAIVELTSPSGSLGTWLVSAYIDQPQPVRVGDRTFNLALRLRRYYKPFSLHLLKFDHDVYPGTDIPKNFSSRVRVENPATGEAREVKIRMNEPLRYGGMTFYQSSYDPDNHGSVLQVVRNPGWLTPYISCGMVGLGLTIQFLSHLLIFLKRKLKT
jgi:hypothetical protein